MNQDLNNQNNQINNGQFGTYTGPSVSPTPQPVNPQPIPNTYNVPVQPQPMPNNYNNPTMAQPIYQQQVPNSVPVVENKKKKSKLPIIIIILLLLAALGGGAYYFFILNGNGSNNPKALAKKYVNNLIKKKYEANYDIVYIVPDAFVKKNDYLDFVQKQSKYEGITEKSITDVSETLLTLEDGKYEVVLKDKNNIESKLVVELKNDKDNGWKVVENSFYIKNWAMVIPKNTTLYIDGEQVDGKYVVEDSTISPRQVKYVIPAITSTKKTIKLENPLQTKELEVTPLSSNSGDSYTIELNDNELVTKAFEYIRNTWNGIYTDYINGVDISDVKNKYFDSTVPVENIETYYVNGLNHLTEGSSGYKYVNYKVLSVVANENKPCYVSTDKMITINFKYKISYNWSFSMANETRIAKNVSSIRLVLDGDSFKIAEITDEKLFNNSRDDWSLKDWE